MKSRALLFAIIISVAATLQSQAATYRIYKDGTGDFVTIQEALSVVISGDALELGPGVWQEPTLVLDRDMIVGSDSGPEETILDGGGAHTGIRVTAGAVVELSDLTIRNCLAYDGAGIHVDNGSEATLTGCRLVDNISTYTGGAGFVRHPGSRLVFQDCSFENNYAPLNAGAVGVSLQSYCGFFGCWFEGNSSINMAGAIANFASSMMEIRGCVFVENSGGECGAIRVYDSPAIIENNTFFSNQSGYGTIYCSSSSSASIRGNIIAAEQGNYGVFTSAPLDMGCNIFFGNNAGPIIGADMAGTDRVADPKFCNASSNDFSVSNDSPALSGAFDCSPIGAFGEGCGSGVEEIEVVIDIDPSSEENRIKCKASRRLIRVAVLSTPSFSATTIDPASIRFGPGEADAVHRRLHERDVNRDGTKDIVLYFRFADTGILCGDTEATLSGETYDGRLIIGSDSITTIDSGRRDRGSGLGVKLTPNPFNPSTVVSFFMEEPGNAKISVFDVRGRLIDLLADDHFDAGLKTVEWMGRDAMGAAAPSGAYFFKIEAGGEVQVQKAVLLK